MSEIRISNIPVISESAGVTTLTANNLTGNLTGNSTGNLTGTVTNLSKSFTTLDTTASNGPTTNADNTTLPLFGCRAFVNFNGASTTSVTVDGATEAHCAIRASGNVSKVVRTGNGDFTIHFIDQMPDANYVVSGVSGNAGATSAGRHITFNDTLSAASCKIRVTYYNDTLANDAQTTLAFFR